MKSCLICNEKEKDNSIYLTNQSFIHKDCEETLYTEIVDLEEVINKSKREFLYFFKNLFFNKKNSVQSKLDILKSKQRNIYDYWSTYPPDWSKRKESLKNEKKVCNRCGKSKSRKHKKDFLEVHHIIPINKGGAHLTSNLEVLCRNCHKEEHLKRPHKVRKRKKILQT